MHPMKTVTGNVKLVLLNGPPGCGKDTGGAHLAAVSGARLLKFAEPLKRSVYVDAGLPYTTSLDAYENRKDKPLPEFGLRSFRQACIDKSENFIKPRYGEDHFGRLFAQRVKAIAAWEPGALIVATDSGFVGEVRPTLKMLGPENVLLIRIHADRRGKTFRGDSRSYLSLPVVRSWDIENNEDGEEGRKAYLDRLEHVVREFEGLPESPRSVTGSFRADT